MAPAHASTNPIVILILIITLTTLPTSSASAWTPSLVIRSKPVRSQPNPFSSLLRQDDQEDKLSQSYILPDVPTTSIPSTNTLQGEIATWSELLLFSLLLNLTEIVQEPGPFVILAPLQFSFITLLQRLVPAQNFFFSSPQDILDNLNDAFVQSDILRDILGYHIIRGNFTEQELANRGLVPTVQGAEIDFTDFPTIRDNDVTYPSEFGPKRRIYRSIETRTGRLLMINAVLLPFNLSEQLEGSGAEENTSGFPTIGLPRIPGIGSPETILIRSPWVSFQNFVSGRTDMQILNALFAIYGRQLQSALRPAGTSHFFAPTDIAFINLGLQLLDDKVDLNEDDPVPDILDAAAGILNVIRGISGIPTLPEILLYHIADTDASYESLIGEASITTLFPNATLSVTEDGVGDNDPSRGPAQRFATFPTFQGWVTVIDSVLLPFDAAIAQAVINANVNAAAASPESCPEEDDGVCFAGGSTVRLSDGRRVRMTDLQAGDEVHVDPMGTSSKIFLFTHRTPALARFVELETESGRSIHLTKGHYLYANGRMTAAGNVRLDDVLETENGNEKVVRVGSVVRRGKFAPHSVHGDLMVDGVRVSAYTKALSPRLGHAVLAPIRALAAWGGFKEPLGSLLYDGIAERWLRPMIWLFGGAEMY